MLQYSKLLNSRNEWRSKAVTRATALRESRKAQKRYQQQITLLKTQINELQQAVESKKKN